MAEEQRTYAEKEGENHSNWSANSAPHPNSLQFYRFSFLYLFGGRLEERLELSVICNPRIPGALPCTSVRDAT